MSLEIRIDTEADAAYIRLRKGKVHRTEELGAGYMLDFSRAGKVIGIEVLHPSKKSAGVLGVDMPERVWQQLQAAMTPIENDQQHALELELLEPVWKAVGENGQHPLGSLLSLMVERIQSYEERRWPGLPHDPAANLRYFMELRGLSQRGLAKETGIEQASIRVEGSR